MSLDRFRVTRRSLLTAVGALGSQRPSVSAAAESLRILCWEGYDGPDATKGFRDANDVEVRADYIGANDEIFTLLRAGGFGKYEIVTPSDGFVHALANARLIQPIDPARLANAAGLFARFESPDWCIVDGQTYGVPLLWHTYPMVYNAGALPDPPAAWTDLTDPRFKGKIVMPDDAVRHFITWNRALGAADPV